MPSTTYWIILFFLLIWDIQSVIYWVSLSAWVCFSVLSLFVCWLICPPLYQCCLLLITVALYEVLIFGPFIFSLLLGDVWLYVDFCSSIEILELVYETAIATIKKKQQNLWGICLDCIQSIDQLRKNWLFLILSSPIHEHCVSIHIFVFTNVFWESFVLFCR